MKELFFTILPFITFAFIPISNAFMDTIKDHFSVSIFQDKDKNFWYPLVSWNAKPKFIGWFRVDAWHIAKAFMIFYIIATILVSKYQHNFHLWYYFIYCFEWLYLFEHFYNKVFIRKK